ncbi:MAG: hypothetical protein GTO63_33435 [Anaerolineae bacterium]|nr:hypothetical protein [Anaerolineae bacterium]
MQQVARTPTLALAFLLVYTLTFGSLVAAQPEPPVELPPVPYPDIEFAIGVATGAGGTGVATFLFTEGRDPWAALVVEAGTPDGIDRVTVTFSMETKTLTIEAEDIEPTNEVSILVSKAFVVAFIESLEDGLVIEVSEAINYQGPTISADAGGAEVYVFVVTHFSLQSIRIFPKIVNDALFGDEGLTATGWAVVGVAVAVVVVAALVAVRKRR